MPDPTPTIEDLRIARRRVADLLACANIPQNFFQLAGLSGLQIELTRARAFLYTLPQNRAEPQTSQAEVAEYRAALRELAELLPRMHGWLLAERARLKNGSAHIAAVEAWLRTTRSLR